ncbi:MAG: MAE_28990/MAE_18760 family HEPN-like nuclease [Pseudomonadota bacterium]|nr:MAE_28990/MAE_18760 family HEPN-like nuclease [Pseudomonadota bacterium]
MRDFEDLLNLRKREVEKHLSFVAELEGDAAGRGPARPVDVEHVNILKSAFTVHLYNVVESTMSQIEREVAEELRAHSPRDWSDALFHAWLRHRAAIDEEMADNDRLLRMVDVITEAVGRRQLRSTRVARPSGNWSHNEVEGFARTIDCNLAIPEEVHKRACLVHFVDEKTPLDYVRHMRNQVAHGNVSFIGAVENLTVSRLRELRDSIMDYLDEVAASFARFLNSKAYLGRPAT